MQVVVFGATGQVGKQLVKQALYKGYAVKAFGRNVFTTDLPKDDNLELIQGALFDEKDVYNALKGCNVVLSALGGAFDGTDVTRSLGIKNIIKQMQKVGLKRIIAVGGMGILNAEDGTLLIDGEDYPQQYIPVGREHLKAYEALKASNLDWTFVCCPDIIDAEATGEFITKADYPPVPNKYQINTGNLALFMLNEAIKNEFVQHRVGISN
ncbi:NAD(P)-dependent oxidoreductase [Ferruginibacter sp. SUN002]|uniref:NAD(P)-dependent oxidoreductase n=1 Tax=Ferruginibacter sp. SUN002 TaxID=2937789 RepID=UPI003D368BC0